MTGAVMNSTDPPWSVVVEGIRAGDPNAMEQLYTIFDRVIRFQFLRQLGPDCADDLTQDLLVTIVTSIQQGKLREPERLMGFVQVIVHRKIASEIDVRVKARCNQADFEDLTLCDRGPNPEQSVVEHERKELAMRILNTLRKRDREVLARFYLEEQPADQICREMGLTDTQFRLVKSRALARFGELGRACLRERVPAAAVM